MLKIDILKDDFSFNLSVGVKATVWDGGKKLRDVSRKVSETKTAKINTEAVISAIFFFILPPRTHCK